MKLNEIQKKARTLLGKFNFQDIPIDVRALAKKLGVRVIFQDLDDDISGLLVIKNDRPTIGVNDAHHPNRQKFTIAHELGHYVLHRDIDDLFIDSKLIYYRDKSSSDGVQQREIEANSFAAEVLMPATLIRKYLKEKEPDLSNEFTMQRMASAFNVSEQALTIRLTRLSLLTV